MLQLTTENTDILCGTLTLRFTKSTDQSNLALQLLPTERIAEIVSPRHVDGIENEVLTEAWRGQPGYSPETCVQLKLRGDHGPKAFAQRRTLRGGPACEALRFGATILK